MSILNLRPDELAIYRHLVLQGSARECHAVAELLDRGWCHRESDGTLRLTRDGAEVAKMIGLDRDDPTARDAARS